jgi:peroxiredoxin
MRQGLAVTALAAVLAGGAWALARGRSGPATGEAADDGTAVRPFAAPEFPAKAVWVQGGPLAPADLRGKVAVVHFWTNGCVNCAHNYPVYKAWQEHYDARKVTIVGVHTPEFDREAPAERVRAVARANGLKFPIVLDNDKAVWNAWGNHYWPAIYLVDKRGRARYRWEGELHLDTNAGKAFARHIDELLAEEPAAGPARGE